CFLAQALADFHPVQPRQHQVEDHDVVTVLGGQPVAVQAVGRVVDFEAAAIEVFADHLGDVPVVLDDQDQAGGFLGSPHHGQVSFGGLQLCERCPVPG